jgi:hypothetical protein
MAAASLLRCCALFLRCPGAEVGSQRKREIPIRPGKQLKPQASSLVRALSEWPLVRRPAKRLSPPTYAMFQTYSG